MVEAAWIEAEVLKAVPEATVEVIDLHGSGDHFHVRIISETFEGVRPLQRQKQVLAVAAGATTRARSRVRAVDAA